ncbi:MAG: hypothetical protein V1870_04555 [Candidatus Aenigmatarchaeota archaeon]
MKKAESYYKNKTKWHFHILMQKCIFSTNKNKFTIILENEDNGDSFVTYFDERPIKDAERLENLLYGRVKMK